MRRALAALMVAGLALIGAVLWAESPAVPGRAASGPPAADAIELKLVSHGYHAGLALRRIDLLGAMDPARHPALEEVLVRYAFADELEIGWGDEGFYRGVPTIADLTVVEALRAFFAPNNPSVLHIVGLPGPAEVVFDASEVISIRLSPQGFSASSMRWRRASPAMPQAVRSNSASVSTGRACSGARSAPSRSRGCATTGWPSCWPRRVCARTV